MVDKREDRSLPAELRQPRRQWEQRKPLIETLICILIAVFVKSFWILQKKNMILGCACKPSFIHIQLIVKISLVKEKIAHILNLQ